MTSSMSILSWKQQARDKGADAILAKPYSLTALFSVIDRQREMVLDRCNTDHA